MLWDPGTSLFPAANHLFAGDSPAIPAELSPRAQNAMTRDDPGYRIGAHRISNGTRAFRLTQSPCKRAVCDRLARI